MKYYQCKLCLSVFNSEKSLQKHVQSKKHLRYADMRMNLPYVVFYTHYEYFFVNRNYKPLGYFSRKWTTYPKLKDIKEKFYSVLSKDIVDNVLWPMIGSAEESFAFYDDGCKPWSGIKQLRDYSNRVKKWISENKDKSRREIPVFEEQSALSLAHM